MRGIFAIATTLNRFSITTCCTMYTSPIIIGGFWKEQQKWLGWSSPFCCVYSKVTFSNLQYRYSGLNCRAATLLSPPPMTNEAVSPQSVQCISSLLEDAGRTCLPTNWLLVTKAGLPEEREHVSPPTHLHLVLTRARERERREVICIWRSHCMQITRGSSFWWREMGHLYLPRTSVSANACMWEHACCSIHAHV